MRNKEEIIQNINKEIDAFNQLREEHYQRLEPFQEELFAQLDSLSNEEKIQVYRSIQESYLKFKLFNILQKEGVI